VLRKMLVNDVPSATGAAAAKLTAPPYVKGLAIAVLFLSACIQVVFWVGNVADPGNDFRTFYTAGYVVRTGNAHNLYDAELQFRLQNQLASELPVVLHYIHPPYEAYLYAPFSLLSYRNAYFAFLAFNLVLLGSSFWWLRARMRNLAAIFPWLPLAIFAAFPPITIALLQGQDSVLLLAILVGAALLLDRNRPFASGALLALGLFRFQIVLPIAVLFLLWRRWRFSAGFTGSAAVLFLVSLAMVGWSGAKTYCANLLSFGQLLPSQDAHLFRMAPRFILNLRGLIFSFQRFHVPHIWLTVLTVLASIGILYLAAKKPASASFTLAIPAAALVSYHFLMHDMSVLLLPLVLVLDQCVRFEGTNDSRRWLFRSAALMFAAPLLQIFLYGGQYFVLLALPVLAFLLLLNAHRTEVTVW
jgi:Glycosyltransferase family 87